MKGNEIDRLQHLYFEGMTSNEEEQRLKELLCSPVGRQKRYDELRAVIGFAETGRCLHGTMARVRPIHPWLRRWAVAAAVVVVVAGVTFTLWRHRVAQANVCVAYIEGRRCADAQVVMGQMKQTMDRVLPDQRDRRMSAEAQLKDLFNTADTKAPDVEVTVSRQ